MLSCLAAYLVLPSSEPVNHKQKFNYFKQMYKYLRHPLQASQIQRFLSFLPHTHSQTFIRVLPPSLSHTHTISLLPPSFFPTHIPTFRLSPRIPPPSLSHTHTITFLPPSFLSHTHPNIYVISQNLSLSPLSRMPRGIKYYTEANGQLCLHTNTLYPLCEG